MDEQKNPWTILRERNIYDKSWINLTEYDVLNPAGGRGIYGKVHFKNYAVAVMVLDENLNTYLVGQYRFPLNQYSWEIPEGGGSFDVDPLESAKRELREETGLVAESWTEIMHFHLSNSVSDEHGIIFLARDVVQHEAMPEETEQIVVKKLPLQEAYKMIESGIITDSLSVAAIQHVKILLLENRL